MSGYGSMNASPFWKAVMHVTGLLCLVTLFTPPAFFFKYLIFDHPGELAEVTTVDAPATPPLAFRYIQLETARASKQSAPVKSREDAISWLQALVLSPNAQVTHPVECMLAKSTLSSIAENNSNPEIQIAASDALTHAAAKGAVIER
jgi:hypothetical protein